jgi:RNA polymerase sigma factor (TIGR02999 family)
VTTLLVAWRGGDAGALDRLLPLVYAELRRVAHRYMRDERRNHPLQTTALVHEAYLRLIDVTRVDWQSRNHFFAVSAQLMRRILVEAARRRNADKRGGDAAPWRSPPRCSCWLPSSRAPWCGDCGRRR